jgi:hypothetical protein
MLLPVMCKIGERLKFQILRHGGTVRLAKLLSIRCSHAHAG